ncbi:hypothetical protein R5R35_003343 [Gryllus longicercus]|uniref:Odorant binding protein n=1 Tax=Gryllus longicercus TaxID=2509291 RepID=A0AAN9VFE3_9ORTH
MAASLAAPAPPLLLALGAVLLLLAAASGQMTESEKKRIQQECVEEIRQGAEDFDDDDGHQGASEKDQQCFQTCVLRKLGVLQNGEMPTKKPKNLASMPDDMYKNARRKCNPAVAKAEKCNKGMALAGCLQKLMRSRRSVDSLLGL